MVRLSTPGYKGMNSESCERELEGVVAKRLSGRYTPGFRGSWIKIKNRG
jgi:ATP-dependent DNA ligase